MGNQSGSRTRQKPNKIIISLALFVCHIRLNHSQSSIKKITYNSKNNDSKSLIGRYGQPIGIENSAKLKQSNGNGARKEIWRLGYENEKPHDDGRTPRALTTPSSTRKWSAVVGRELRSILLLLLLLLPASKSVCTRFLHRKMDFIEYLPRVVVRS